MWLELSEGDQADYKVTKGKMVAKMVPMGFVSLATRGLYTQERPCLCICML